MSDILLEASQLRCERDERVLFERLDFSVRPGQLIQVAGPNGSGKTTLLRILAGLHTFYEGQLRWCGEPLESVRESFFANMLFLGHSPGVKPALTALENLAVAVRSTRPVSDRELDQALQAAGLAGYEDVPTRQLSAGQHRRVALARLYLSEAPLWILDEAFTAIDREGVAVLESLLQERVRQGGAVIFTTHHGVNMPDLETLYPESFAPEDPS